MALSPTTPKSRANAMAPTAWAPVLLFLVGCALACAAAYWKHQSVRSSAELQFQQGADAVAEHIGARFMRAVYGLEGARGVYAARNKVSRAEFRAYVESRDLASQFVGVRGFGFVQRVPRSDLAAFIAAERADGAPQFALRQLTDKSHDDLYIVKYLEPAVNNIGALGVDIGSEAMRRTAVQRAIDTGMPTVSTAIKLIQDQRQTPGVLIFVPVYASGARPITVAGRRTALVGVLDAPLVMSELLDGMTAVKEGLIDFELFDGPPTPAGTLSGALLFDADRHTEAPGAVATADQRITQGARFSETRALPLLGRELSLRVNSTAKLDAEFDQTSPWLLLVGGTLLSALVAQLFRQQLIARRRADGSAATHSVELTLQKYALDQHAIVASTDVQGKITYANDKFCDISGYSREELMGQDHAMLNSGTHPDGFFKAMYHTVATGATWHNEVCNRAKDGHLFWVDTTVVPVINSKGKPERYLVIRTDITLRKQVELDLVEHQLSLEKRVQQKSRAAILSEQHLRLVMDTSLDAIVGMDARGLVNEWSRQAETTFGWSFTEVQGQPLHHLIIPERYREAHQKGLAHYQATGVGPILGKRIEIFALRRDGTEFPIELAISPIVTPEGTTFSAFIADVTQRKQEQAALMTAKALAESASRAKNDFLANMSHEIRTPMNGVIGMVEILQATQLQPAQQRMLRTMKQSSRALLVILNDILDFSKIEAGKLDVESVPTPLYDVADAVVQLMAPAAQGKALALSLDIDPALPEWALSDPVRLHQILLNLLGNAVKFTTAGDGRRAQVGLHMAPCVLRSGDTGLHIAVQDSGIGMVPEVLSKLFQPFTQADESTSRKFGGTGLGLSITLRLVELMGGRISVNSTLGEGSEFVVEIPLLPCEAANTRPAPLTGATATYEQEQEQESEPKPSAEALQYALQTGSLILLAEDNETNRDVMQEQLRLLGYTCETAENGAVALQMWQDNPGRYALLLTDCHMPHLDGFGLTSAIRQAEDLQDHLPIIAVTANAMQGEAQRCRDHCMDEYLSKPLSLDALKGMLAKWMPQARPMPAYTAQPRTPVWLLAATLAELVGDNPGMHQRLLGKFLVSAPQQVGAITAAAAALDTHTLADVAHTLKSAARSIGALRLGDVCQRLETSGRAGDVAQCTVLAAGLVVEFAAAAAAINDFTRTSPAVL